MMKRIFSFIMSLVLVLSMLPVQAMASEVPAEETTASAEIVTVEETQAVETEPVAETEPVVQETEPVAEETEPATEETEPAVEETESVTEETEPATEETEPAVEETTAEETDSNEAMDASAGVKNETYLQELYDSNIRKLDCNVILENDYIWPDKNSSLVVAEGVTLMIPSGKTLTLGVSSIYGTIVVESGGALILNNTCYMNDGGTLLVEAGSSLTIYDNMRCEMGSLVNVAGSFDTPTNDSGWEGKIYRKYENGVFSEVYGIPEEDQELRVDVYSESELREVLTFSETHSFNRCIVGLKNSMTVNSNIIFPKGYIVNVGSNTTFTVGENCTLTNHAGIGTDSNSTIVNNGVIENNGGFSLWCKMDNNGIFNMYSGELRMYGDGTFNNNGTFRKTEYAYIYLGLGVWNGPDPVSMVLDETYLQSLLDGEDKWPVMNGRVILKKNFTITGDINVFNINGTITVPKGKTLTIQDVTTFVNEAGSIIVDGEGTLIVNGSLSCWGKNSAVMNYGTVKTTNGWGRVIANYEGREFVTKTKGIPYKMLWLRFIVNNDADLQNAIKVMNETDYVQYLLLVHGDIELSADVTIPENCELLLSDSPSTLTIPAGRTLTNNGHISVNQDQVIHNFGTVESNGTCTVYGKVINDGVFKSKNWVDLYGSWQGNDPEYDLAPMTQAELEAAMKEAGGYYYLRNEVTLTKELKVTGTLSIGPGGHLIVPKGKKLTVNADSSINVEPGGILEMQGTYELKKNADGWKSAIHKITFDGNMGTVTGIKDVDVQTCGVVFDAANFPVILKTVQDHPNAEYNFIEIYTDLELPGDVTIPENCLFHIYQGASVTVPSGVTLTNKGQFHCWEGQRVKNYGTIENQNFFLVLGTLENAGQMNLQPGSALVVDGPGYVNNIGSMDAYALNAADLFGTWDGYPINYHCISQAEFEDMLAAGGKVTLDKTVTLEENLTIDESVELMVSGGSIVVPDGVVLTLNSGTTLHEGGILVQDGGELVLNSMIFMHYNGVLKVDGEYQSKVGDGDNIVTFYENGLVPCTVTGIPVDRQRLHVLLRDQSQYWQAGIELFENNGYSKAFLEILNNVTLPKDLTIPENGYVLIEGNATKLTVPAGKTLTNHGVLRIDEAKSLWNYGTIKNHGYLYVRANLFNYGTIEMLPAATGSARESVMDMVEYGFVDNNGEVILHLGSRIDRCESSGWGGYTPIWEYITQDRLEAAIAAAAENGQSYVLNTSVALERDLIQTKWPLIIGAEGYLLVPEGISLITEGDGVFVQPGGELDVQGTCKVNNGCIAEVFNNGSGGTVKGVAEKDIQLEFYVYNAQDLAVAMQIFSERPDTKRNVLSVFGDVEWTEDAVIPAKCVVHFYNNSCMTISEGVTLTNNGEIYVWEGTTLLNDGVIQNNECITVRDGMLLNNGTIQLASDTKVNAQNPRIILNSGTLANNGSVNLAKNSYVEVFGTWEGNIPVNNGGRIYPQATSLTIDGGESRLIDIRETTYIDLKITAAEFPFQVVTWNSSNDAVVDVSQIKDLGNGTYRVPFLGAGKAKLTATTIDGKKLIAAVNLEVEEADWSPRLGSKNITLNPMLYDGAYVTLMPTHDNDIVDCWVDDDRLGVEYNDIGGLILYANEPIKNGKISTVLSVKCEKDGVTYTYPLTITVKNTAPAVTVKQENKLDLFYTDSKAALSVTAKDTYVNDVELVDTSDFYLDGRYIRFSDVFIRDYMENPKLKPDTKATLLVYLDGYQQPVEKAITIGTTTSKLTLSTNPSSSTVHTALSTERTISFQIQNKSTKTALNLQASDIVNVEGVFVDGWQVENGALTLSIAGEKGGTASIYVRQDNWMQPVKVTHKVTINTKQPTVKLAASTLKLSSIFTDNHARTDVILSHNNLKLDGFSKFVSTAKEGSAAWQEASKLTVFYNSSNNTISAWIKSENNVPKNGTYTFTAVPNIGGTELKPVTLKVNVNAALPKVKLSGSSVKLNTQLTGAETASVAVTLNNTTGYRLKLVDFKGMDAYQNQVEMTYSQDKLNVKLLTQREGKYSFQLIPIVEDSWGTAAELPAVKLTVQSYDKDVSVTLSSKGSLDAINRYDPITYTVTKVSNALGEVENVELVQGGEWFEISRLYEDAKGNKTFNLALQDEADVSIKETYPVQFKYTVCGKEFLSKVIKLKVKQTTLKIKNPTVTYYMTQEIPIYVEFDISGPDAAEIGELTINEAKTSKELKTALGRAAFFGRAFAVEVFRPDALTCGKSYKLVLDMEPYGHAEGAKPIQITITIKVAK